MVRSEKRLGELSRQLKNRNPLLVIETITMLRDIEPFPGAVTILAETYDNSDNQAIKATIRDFLNDLKESSAREEVITGINSNYKQSTLAMLVSSCWQSGLDYSQYLTDFARAFNKGDYTTAIECFTVIEEYTPRLTRENKDEILIILDEKRSPDSDDKSVLLKELVSILG
jgi:hypothetical protein